MKKPSIALGIQSSKIFFTLSSINAAGSSLVVILGFVYDKVNNVKRVLIFTTSMGHRSIAEAARAAFKEAGWRVKLVSFEFREATLQYYPAYKLFPTLNKVGFELTQNGKFENLFRKIFKVRKLGKLENVVKRFEPDLVLSTYFLYNPPLEKLAKECKFKLFNYVCNPRTFHPLELSKKAHLNLVYDEEARKRALELGVADEKVKAIGWLVRPRFYEVEEIPGELFTLTVSAGSLGAQGFVKFLPIFSKLSKPIHLNLIAGSNKMLFNIFKSYQKMTRAFEDFVQNKNEVEVYGFTEEIDKLMAQSHVVAGKAGPNLLFESVAVGRPFLALSHIPGQEDGNLEIIDEKNLGWVAEQPSKAREILELLMEAVTFFEEKKKALEEERSYIRTVQRNLINYAVR
ncbi:MAG: glycosyltransferase [Patescibacteria group bacterium]|nr:glycosyltransferase [Patescibacteria group bacterium]